MDAGQLGLFDNRKLEEAKAPGDNEDQDFIVTMGK